MKKNMIYLIIATILFSGCNSNSTPEDTVKSFILDLNEGNLDNLDDSIVEGRLREQLKTMPEYCYKITIRNITNNSKHFVNDLIKDRLEIFSTSFITAISKEDFKKILEPLQSEELPYGANEHVQEEMNNILAEYFIKNNTPKLNESSLIDITDNYIKLDTKLTNTCLNIATEFGDFKDINLTKNGELCSKDEECIVEGTLTHKYNKLLDRPYIKINNNLLSQKMKLSTQYDNKENTKIKFTLKNINGSWKIKNIDDGLRYFFLYPMD